MLTGKHTRPNQDAMLSMFSALESRGTDASGFASSYRGKLWTYKTPEASSVTVNKLKNYKMDEARAWVGHTRLATHGTHLENSNNHPFINQGLALIHNGIVSNYDKVLFGSSFAKLEGDCDSELILSTIVKYRPRLGVTGAIKQMAKELSGAMACALINRPGELWLWHREFSKRYSMTPIIVAVSTHTPNLHFASTKQILETSLSPRLSWDVGSLDAGKGIHIKIVKGKLQIINFDVPDCDDKSYDWGYDYDYELSRFDYLHRQVYCRKCYSFQTIGHLCNMDNVIDLNQDKEVLDPEEDALYYCETDNCNTLLGADEVMTHTNQTGHLVYRKEIM